MLQQPIFSIFIRLIPEAIMIIYSIFSLNNIRLKLKVIFIGSILGSIGVFIARLLPVHFGVHTIISIIIYIIFAVKLFHIEIYKSIATVLITHIILFISDLLLIIIYTELLQLPAEIVMGKTWIANVAGIPSLIIYYFIIKLICYLKKKKVNNYEQH